MSVYDLNRYLMAEALSKAGLKPSEIGRLLGISGQSATRYVGAGEDAIEQFKRLWNLEDKDRLTVPSMIDRGFKDYFFCRTYKSQYCATDKIFKTDMKRPIVEAYRKAIQKYEDKDILEQLDEDGLM